MPFFPKKETPKEAPKEIPKERPAETSFFGNKKEISRREFRERLRGASSRIPGTTRKYYKKERAGLEKGFGKEYGSYISKREFKRHLWKLKRERFKERNPAKKAKIKDEIRYFEEHGGTK